MDYKFFIIEPNIESRPSGSLEPFRYRQGVRMQLLCSDDPTQPPPSIGFEATDRTGVELRGFLLGKGLVELPLISSWHRYRGGSLMEGFDFMVAL